MQKKGSGAMIISIVLIIAAMVIGIFIGILIGKSSVSENTAQSDDVVISSESTTQIDTESVETEEQTESKESMAADGDVAVVMTVGGNDVSMDEVNVRLYSLRSYYVQSYGEEPWGQTLEDGTVLADAAKQTLEDDIIRAEIFMQKAADYGVTVTDDMIAICSDEAQKFVDGLGEAVAGEFGLKKEAVEAVYIKYEVITALTNIINDEIRAEILADEANADLSESELDIKISELFQQQEEAWKNEFEVEYTDIWENIVVGSVG